MFTSGTEYEVFLYNYCERCKHYKLDKSGCWPAFPEDGGCFILDAMERARFDESVFPSEYIIEQRDEEGNVIKFNHCINFVCNQQGEL